MIDPMRLLPLISLIISFSSWSQNKPVMKYLHSTRETYEYSGLSNEIRSSDKSAIIESYNENGDVTRRDFSNWRETYYEFTYDSLDRLEYEIEVNTIHYTRDSTAYSYSQDTMFWTDAFGELCYIITDDQDRMTVLSDPSTFSDKVLLSYKDGLRIMVTNDGLDDSEVKSFYNEHGHLVKKTEWNYFGPPNAKGERKLVLYKEEWHYEYKFNEHGDWVEALEYQGETLVSKRTRVIRYW